MRRTFASYLSAWKSSGGSDCWIAAYLVASAFAAASLVLMLAPRTFLGQGFAPHPLWPVAFALLMLLPLAWPAGPRLPQRRAVWRWAPLLLGLCPLVPLTVQVGLVVVAAG